jgi:hypothetical protein
VCLHAAESDVAQNLVLTACLWVAKQQLHTARGLALGCICEQDVQAVPVAAGHKQSTVTKQGAAGKTVNLYLRRWCVPASPVLVLCEHSCKSMVATCIVESVGLKQPALNALLLC